MGIKFICPLSLPISEELFFFNAQCIETQQGIDDWCYLGLWNPKLNGCWLRALSVLSRDAYVLLLITWWTLHQRSVGFTEDSLLTKGFYVWAYKIILFNGPIKLLLFLHLLAMFANVARPKSKYISHKKCFQKGIYLVFPLQNPFPTSMCL